MDGHDRRDRVRATYDRIADHFAQTRSAPWPEIRAFVDQCEPVSWGCDIGCGNGRHLPILQNTASDVLGLDSSRETLRNAREHRSDGVEIIQADAGILPLCDHTIGVATYIATLHHLPNRQARIESLNELARVLELSGRALISVWSVTDDRFDFDEGQDRLVPWTLPDGTAVKRFYHIYDREDFMSELTASTLQVVSIEESAGNWYAEVTRS